MNRFAPLLSLINPPLGFFLLGRHRWALAYLLAFALSLALNRLAIEWLNSFVLLQPFGFTAIVSIMAAVHAGIIARTEKLAPRTEWVPLLPLALASLAAPWLLREYHSEILKVQSLSMAPSLHRGDLVVMSKFSALNRWLQPASTIDTLVQGDRIVFLSPEDGRYYVKRLVGLPGDRIHYRSGQLSINQALVKQQFLTANRRSDVHLEYLNNKSYPIIRAHESKSAAVDMVVPPDTYFVLGDNRDNSKDSRHFGVVPKQAVQGFVADSASHPAIL